MAKSSEDEIFYRAPMTYGSLAYDFEPETEMPAYEEPKAPGIDIRKNIGARQKPAPRSHQSVAPAAVLGFLIAAVLITIGMVARIQLLEVSNASAELTEQLSDLKEENTRLQIQYESTFNLTEIENYAINELGMQKPVSDQIIYIDTAAADKAVVVPQAASKGFFARAWEFITSVGSYLN